MPSPRPAYPPWAWMPTEKTNHCWHGQKQGEWSIPVIGMPVADLHRKLPGVVGDRYDGVVIDTPPMKERRGVVASAIRIATHVLVPPMAPTGMEYARIPAIRELVEEAGALAVTPPSTCRCVDSHCL